MEFTWNVATLVYVMDASKRLMIQIKMKMEKSTAQYVERKVLQPVKFITFKAMNFKIQNLDEMKTQNLPLYFLIFFYVSIFLIIKRVFGKSR